MYAPVIMLVSTIPCRFAINQKPSSARQSGFSTESSPISFCKFRLQASSVFFLQLLET